MLQIVQEKLFDFSRKWKGEEGRGGERRGEERRGDSLSTLESIFWSQSCSAIPLSLGITRETFSSALEDPWSQHTAGLCLLLFSCMSQHQMPWLKDSSLKKKKKILLSDRNKTSAPGKFIPLVGVDKSVCSFTRAFGVLFNRTQTGSKKCCLSGFSLLWQDAICGLLCCVYT